MRKSIIIILSVIAILAFATPSVQGCNRVVVRQGDDLVKVFSAKNTRYFISDALDLGGKKVKIGEGSTLVFRGGSMANGTVVGNNTKVKAKNYEIFKRGYVRYRASIESGAKRNSPPKVIKERHDYLVVEGTWNNKTCCTNWTGLENNCREDAMLAVQNYVTLHSAGSNIVFPKMNILGYERAILPGDHVIDFNNSTISYPDNLAIWEDKTISIPHSSTPCPLESGWGLITLKSNTKIMNLNLDGKSACRQNEPVRLGVSCILQVGNANNVIIENVSISNIIGTAMVAQVGAKDVLFRSCCFYNIGEHVMYSHQHRGFCHFEDCTFDTWDSKRVSEYRDGLDYLYKHVPHYENGEVSYDELYRFDLSFDNCNFNNPQRVNFQGRTLGAFFTGTFPVVIKVNNCKFSGVSPAVNPGKGCSISEEAKMPYRLVVRGCDGAPYVYSSKTNCNIILELYDCVNIPFRTIYAKRYERCVLNINLYESNTENVTHSFIDEFSKPLVIKDCIFIDSGEKKKIYHPIFHRPVWFENCTFPKPSQRNGITEIITIKDGASPHVMFNSCLSDLPENKLVGGKVKAENITIIR